MSIDNKEFTCAPFDINNFININTNIHCNNNENIGNLNINNLLINNEENNINNLKDEPNIIDNNENDIDNIKYEEINTIDFIIEKSYEEQFYNIIYRNNIIIDKNTDTIINKYVNLNKITPYLDNFFEKYEKYNNQRNFFWLILSLFYIEELDLFDFVYTLFNYSKNYNIYNKYYTYNSLKKLKKDDLLIILKEFINLNRINFIFFLLYFKHYF